MYKADTIRLRLSTSLRSASLEKRKPGAMAKVFSDHPPTGDRITKSQQIIQKYLKEKPDTW